MIINIASFDHDKTLDFHLFLVLANPDVKWPLSLSKFIKLSWNLLCQSFQIKHWKFGKLCHHQASNYTAIFYSCANQFCDLQQQGSEYILYKDEANWAWTVSNVLKPTQIKNSALKNSRNHLDKESSRESNMILTPCQRI